ncbi:MAG: NYN domain-containing protein [Eubacteriales bacterium]|nr:NYN domain-containing protein [Eubacteriales bacterium]
MQKILVVDGYNVIHAWPNLREYMKLAGLAAARDQLLRSVHDYAAGAGYFAIVVFDAHHGHKQRASVEHLKGMDVVYTGSGETADHYIERVADELDGMNCELYVVTADRLEQSIVLGRGGVRVSPRELLEDISLELKARKNKRQRNAASIAERVSPDILKALEELRRQKGVD